MIGEETGLENPLLAEEVEVEETSIDDAAECTDDYFSNAYGQQYCVGDTIETADGPMVVTSIWEGQAVTDVYGGDLDADELYPEMGVAMGMTEQQFAEFIDSYNELKREAAALETSHHVLGPTEMERGRLGIRIRQANPDWTEDQINAEIDRILADKIDTADQYADLARREAELFEQYGMQSQNHATFGEGIWVDADGNYFKFTGSNGHWQQTSQDDGFLDYAVPIGIAIGAGLITGGGIGSSGFWGTIGGSAAKGAIGSAITQAGMTGSIDPSSLVQAAILAGLGGLAEAAINGDMTNWGAAGQTVDEAIWDMADFLQLDYDEVVGILEGMASGAITGDDLTDVLAGAVGGWGEGQVMDFLRDTYGDTVNVDDWFKDGQSNIPIEALEPFVEQIVGGIIDGSIDDPQAWAETIWDYFQSGGDVDFMLPDGVDLGGFFGSMGDWDLSLCGEDGPWYCDMALDLGFEFPDISLPDVDLEFDFPDLGLNIGDPCSDEEGNEGFLNEMGLCDVQLPDVELPDVELPDVELPDVVECVEGWEWSDLLEKCVEIELPDVEPPDVELPDVEIPDVLECMEGFEWSDLYGECIPKINDDITIERPDFDLDIDVPDIDVDVPDIDVDVPDIDVPDWNVGDPCSDEEGNPGILNEMGLCDISMPDMPLSSGNTAGAYTPEWGELFAYTPFTPAMGKKIADVDLGLLSEARKILG